MGDREASELILRVSIDMVAEERSGTRFVDLARGDAQDELVDACRSAVRHEPFTIEKYIGCDKGSAFIAIDKGMIFGNAEEIGGRQIRKIGIADSSFCSARANADSNIFISYALRSAMQRNCSACMRLHALRSKRLNSFRKLRDRRPRISPYARARSSSAARSLLHWLQWAMLIAVLRRSSCPPRFRFRRSSNLLRQDYAFGIADLANGGIHDEASCCNADYNSSDMAVTTEIITISEPAAGPSAAPPLPE